MTLDAYAHEALPFEKLVEAAQQDKERDYSPLFKVVFTLQNVPIPSLTLPGLSLMPMEVERTTAKYDLVLNMWNTETGLLGSLEYSDDLFEASTAKGLEREFREVAAAIVANPDARLADVRNWFAGRE